MVMECVDSAGWVETWRKMMVKLVVAEAGVAGVAVPDVSVGFSGLFL